MNYKKMPLVKFDHFILRSIKKSDYKDLFEYGSNPEVVKTLSWGPMVFRKEAKRAIREIFFTRPKRGIPVGYAIVDLDKNKMIGTIDFHTRVSKHNAVEIGYVIHHDYWNKGIMTKALCEVVKIGFEYYHYEMLIIKHLKNNPASGRVIKKNGFIFVKSYPYRYEKVIGILESDMMVYEMTKERYNEIKSS